MTTAEILHAAKAAKAAAARLTAEQKNKILLAMADALLADTDTILAANAADIANAQGTVPDVMLDRLLLNRARVADMAAGICNVAALPDPVGRVHSTKTLENGLSVRRVSVPMGVIGMIYESRPNVTADAAALCLKSGNVCVLRGGKEAIASNTTIVNSLRCALESCGASASLVNLITDTSRESATALMTARGLVDLLIPRGGAGLIRACVDNAKVPCIETGTGICHIYVDKAADLAKAVNILYNAKTSRPSVCNAAEVCLVHKDVAAVFLPMMAQKLAEKDVQLRLDTRAGAVINGLPAEGKDFDTEFLDYILAVKVVDSEEEAIAHIALHSTGHSEAIISEDARAVQLFQQEVDSAAVYANASTRFTDGGVFGLGCEIGISTQKLGARGPMGLCEMTSYKYVITGNGQVR